MGKDKGLGPFLIRNGGATVPLPRRRNGTVSVELSVNIRLYTHETEWRIGHQHTTAQIGRGDYAGWSV